MNKFSELSIALLLFALVLSIGARNGGSTGSDVTTPSLTTPTATVTPASNSFTTAQNLGVTMTASGSSGTPTGSVVLSSGSYTSSCTTAGQQPIRLCRNGTIATSDRHIDPRRVWGGRPQERHSIHYFGRRALQRHKYRGSVIAIMNSFGIASVTLTLPSTKGRVAVTAQDQLALGGNWVSFTELPTNALACLSRHSDKRAMASPVCRRTS